MEKSQNNLKLFENKKIRYVWNAEEEEWYFSVVDIVEILTESDRPRKYWNDLKKKLSEEGSEGGVPKVWGSPNYFKFTSEFKSAKI